MMCRLALALVLCMASACIAPLPPDKVYNVSPESGSTQQVVLLNSNSSKVAMSLTDAFVRGTQFSVQAYSLGGKTSDARVVASIEKIKPGVIVAFGGHAVQLAHQYYPSLPLVYSLVSQDESHPITGEHVTGVGLQLSTTTEFTMYRLVLGGQLKRVVTYYTPGRSDHLIASAKQELQALGLELVALPATAQSLVEAGRKKEIERSDAVWWFNDPGLATKQSFGAALDLATQAHKPLLCSSFRELAAAGALMAFTLDLENMGAQVAELVDEMMVPASGAQPPAGLRAPLGGHLVLNSATADKLAISLPANAQPFVSEVISSAAP